MGLSNDLISQFAKITNDNKVKQTESTVYGTVSILDGRPWVKIDGSDRLTPADTTTAVADGERVTILVKNHTATITGNVSSPAARNKDVSELSGKIDEFDTVIADTVKAETANIETAIITKLDGKYATFEGLDAKYASITSLDAAEADIDTLKADNVTINQKLTARDAEIDQLKADSLTVQVADAKYATIDNLTGTNAKLNNLESTYGEFVDLTTDKLEAIEGAIADLDVGNLDAKYATIAVLQSDYITADEIAATYITASAVAANYAKISTLESDYIKTTDLEANYITAAMINSKYAEIDLANVDIASIGTVLANIGLITSATIVDGHVTGYLDSVEVNANNITAGTLTVDRLIISGSDKSIIYAINNAGELTSTETDTINGDAITKRTIAADHIVAGAITANEIHSSAVTADKIATNAVTADKIAANAITSGKIAANAITADKIDVIDLNALGATIGSFKIGDNSIYSGTKSTVNNTTRGIYMDTDGQVAFGDANNYLKFHKDQNGTYKLDIAAESLKFGSGTSVKDAIEEVQTSANNAQTAANNAQNTANTANTTANNAVDKVNNLQVGGRNLLLNSARVLMTGSDQGSNTYTSTIENDYVKIVKISKGNAYNNTGGIKTALTRKKGEQYTVSFDVLTPTDIGFYWYPSEKYNDSHQGTHISASSNWQKVSFTYTQTGADATGSFLFGFYYLVAGETYCYRNLKLEKGNKATDWTPAPEDVDAKIDATISKVDVMYAQNTSSTSAPTSGWATTAPTWTDGKYIWTKTVTTYVSGTTSESTPVCITGAKGVTGSTGVGISSITELYYAGPSTTAPSAPTAAVTTNNTSTYVSWNKAMPTYSASYPHYFTCSQVYYTDGTYKWTTPVYAGALTSANATANSAVNTVNNLSIGGRNYFSTKTQSAQKFDSNGEFRLHDYQNVGSFTQFYNLTVPMSTFVGKECVLSFDVISPNGETPISVYNSNGNARYVMNVTGLKTPISTSWTTQTLKITVSDKGTNYDVNNSNKIEIYCSGKMGCKIRNVKFEIGNKATDWTPAPEDINQNITDAVNGVQVGGRNYIVLGKLSSYTPYNSKPTYSGTTITTTCNSTNTASYFTLGIDGFAPVEGEIYTLSGYIKVNGEIPSENFIQGRPTTYGDESGFISNMYNATTGYFEKTQKYTGSWILHSFSKHVSGSAEVITFDKLKFEKGNKATDWTPAPEDVDAGISNAQSTANTAVTNAATAQSTADTANNKVDNLQVGDKNLILASGKPQSSTEYQVATYQLSEDWVPGQVYTLIVKGQHNSSYFGFYRDSGWRCATTISTSSSNNYIASKTFTCPSKSDSDTDSRNNILTVFNQPNNVSHNSSISWIKLVKGNVKLTDWTPAPEDVDAGISNAQSTANNAQATANSALSRVTIKDTRNDNQNPQWYMTNYNHQIVQEFKLSNVIGLSGEMYCYLETTVPWGDPSGGFPKQVAKINGKQYWRVGTSNTTWSAWNDPGATATNHMNFDSTNGLVISQDATANAGNVQIKSDGFRIRNGTTVNASFLGNTITLGQNSTSSYINMCGDKGQIKVGTSQWGDDALIMLSDDIELMSDTSTSLLCKPDSLSDSLKSGYSYCHVYGSQMSAGYRPESTIGTYAVDSSSNARVSRLTCDITGMMLETNYAGGVNKNYLSFHYSDGGATLYSTDKVTLKVHETGIDPYIEITDDTTNNSGYGKIYMTANTITINPIASATIDSPLTVTGLLTANGGIRLPNGVVLEGLNKAGLSRGLIHYATDNSTYVGYGGYANSEGCHYVCGNEIRFLTRASTSSFVPYYKAGDSVSLLWNGAGFISNSKQDVLFTIPLSMPMIGNPTATVTSVSGVVIRQNDKYCYGSGSGSYVAPSSYTAVRDGSTFVRVTARMSNTTNVSANNDACGVQASIKITFS